jgi:hypothetical protein
MRLSIIISREEFLTPREDTTGSAESVRLEEQVLYAAAARGMRKVQMLTDLEFQSTMSGLLASNLRDGLEQANQSNIRVSDHHFSIQVIPHFKGLINPSALYFHPSKAASAGCIHNSSRTKHPALFDNGQQMAEQSLATCGNMSCGAHGG